MKLEFMNKTTFLIIFLIFTACDSNIKDEEIILTGIVAKETSCSGGAEPVFIIKLSEIDSIITGTLPDEFQIPDLEIQFKTKENSFDLFCTADKVYPESFDVNDVKLK